MPTPSEVNLWDSAEHALDYLRRADSIPHRVEGESTLLEFIPADAKRILDLGSGGGRLLALVKAARPHAQFVGLDFSPTMLDALRKLFAGDRGVKIVVSAAAAPAALYQGGRLNFEFQRAASRLVEMQAKSYLAGPHRG